MTTSGARVGPVAPFRSHIVCACAFVYVLVSGTSFSPWFSGKPTEKKGNSLL